VVRAPELTAEAIKAAMIRGDFYASTGVELDDYQASLKQITIKMKENRFQAKYRTQFIGKNGCLLQGSTANPAVYSIKRDEGYVRARITDSIGKMAWTQPFFVH
jgi:hypothetical protein